MAFTLDSRLQADCFVLGRLEFCQLLLMNNAALPWFVLVPVTSVTEVCDLTSSEQALLWEEVNSVAKFVRSNFQIDKLNIGAIGNVVSQLHVHIVGRREDDYCWPGVVWGSATEKQYTEKEVAAVISSATENLQGFKL
ncbi:MAG: HIT domain-containing protein [Gammaproteobacteria bacterium]|nr:HIT domain-containing protein [Gammaproteobacteria bacterium]MCP4091397.1 HIT domain-containing protein [Gammaproteobacteria bacterium]MCP4275645.1 HIT domain-containing protein [Gammaproteobacteria bacterium]MCP4831443.1 HIT domain-containing protein [Gammaproteobacteria bacterium]MCP4927677.1 HIT domain-containing protein [Gammaproteobacteria bacterium]